MADHLLWIRVSIYEQFVLRRYTHLKGYGGLERRGGGDLPPICTPDRGPLQTPFPTLGMMSPPAPAICPTPPQGVPIDFCDLSIGRPFGDGPMSMRGGTYLGSGKHLREDRPGYHLFGYLTASAQNPEDRKKAQVGHCYLALSSSF